MTHPDHLRAVEAIREALHQCTPDRDIDREYIIPALESAAIALESLGGGWQPIETAPKDGTEILVFSPERPAGKESTVVFWKNSKWAFFEMEGAQLNILDKLTHWMPLPLPPGAVPVTPAQLSEEEIDTSLLREAIAFHEQGWTPFSSEIELYVKAAKILIERMKRALTAAQNRSGR